MINIVFGKPTATVATVADKYETVGAITVEAIKEAGKSRRVIFNKLAAEQLNLENGNPQTVMFGYVTDGDRKFIIISDVSGLANNPTTVVFKTSKNAVKYGETDQYKGKAISNSTLIKHINSHLGESEEEREYAIRPFEAGQEAEDLGYDLYELIPMDEFVDEVLDVAIEAVDSVVTENTDAGEQFAPSSVEEVVEENDILAETGNTGSVSDFI